MASKGKGVMDKIVPVAHYQEFSPGPGLAGCIECFWASAMEASPGVSSVHHVLPDGCMDIIFDLRAAVSNSGAFVVGTMTRPLAVSTSGPVDYLGVRFRPGGLSTFMPFQGTELVDERVELANFWGGSAGDVWDQLAETTPAGRVNVLRMMLAGRAKERLDEDPFVRHCVDRMEAGHGNVRISDLERSTGLSARQLERKFARHIGISPKAFARVVRFKGVLAAAGAGAPDWANIAAEFGFADQAHLVREFKTFAGQSPAAYLAGNGEAGGDVGFLQDAVVAVA